MVVEFMNEINGFHLTGILCRACLGEITPNFRRIYWIRNEHKISLKFYLEQDDEEDVVNIQDEIVWYFTFYLEQLLEDASDDEFELTFDIIFGTEQFLNTQDLKNFDEVYRRKEVFD